jgi:uncharacterized FAD-dependent dehydrogenase
MIRISELKLPLSALPLDARRASDAPTETLADRAPLHPLQALRQLAAQVLEVDPSTITQLEVFKRSFDARKADVMAVYIVDVDLAPTLEASLLAQQPRKPHVSPTPDMRYRWVAQAPATLAQRPVVVGFGPCGIFAALLLAQMGFKPIVLERGKNVRERTKDTWGLWRKNTLHPGSNVQFGEGGAGTFSDGKLWSQIKDPQHLGRKVMQEFVHAGAPADILFEAHPHIGTFKLVKVVESMRAQIIALGGEVRFEHCVESLLFHPDTDSNSNSNSVTDASSPTDLTDPRDLGQATTGNASSPSSASAARCGNTRQLRGLVVHQLSDGSRYELLGSHVVMALGHSARDSFAMLHACGVAMQAKPFSIGFRIEHPQTVIDRARWGRHAGHPMLGAADYKLVHHAENGRAVYSFCMCPGGTVVAATSEPERVVTNGMSQYSRNERNANAGIVVGIDPQDFPQDEASFVHAFGPEKGRLYARQAQALQAQQPLPTMPTSTTSTPQARHADSFAHVHPLAGIALQRQLESTAYVLGGANYEAPGQKVGDFLAARPSTAWDSVQPSYRPGVKPTDLAGSLPPYAIAAIREALPAFGKKIKGFDMADALLTGVETRTSSPIKIPRGTDFQSSNVRGLYPAGEGASYAGGILSAAVDGIKVAQALALALCALYDASPSTLS